MDFVLGPTGLLTKVSELGKEESLVRRGQDVADVVGNVKQDGSLILNHFWGEETYVTTDFLTDTTDFLHPEIVSAMIASSDETISSLFLLRTSLLFHLPASLLPPPPSCHFGLLREYS